MKKIYTIILSLIMSFGIFNCAKGQSVTVSGSLFLPQDSIVLTFSEPSFTSNDWIGIYKVGQVPGGGAESVVWDYIYSSQGTLSLKAPGEAGKYKAYLCCCDGYDVVAVSSEFSIEIPSITASFPNYVQGDSIVFSYNSPRFSATDKIAIYDEGTKPGATNQPKAWKYISGNKGTITFKDALDPWYYDAYLLCCDGYDSISACNFVVTDSTIAFVTPKKQDFEPGTSLDFKYNDPDFATGDWIGIYPNGEETSGAPITWSQIVSMSGIVSFPGVLPGGYYIAVLKDQSSVTEYARSDPFNIAEQTSESYIKTAAGVYPLGYSILVNYKDDGFVSTDWIGIYKQGDTPGGPEAIVWKYAPNDSSTVEFSSLPIGNYVVYLLCCDGYDIKAKYDFKVVGADKPSLIFSSITFDTGDPLEFVYNDPDFESGAGLDWLGIYYEGDIPADVRSIIWDYLPNKNGTMTFTVPYLYGTLVETNPDLALPAGEYWAGLFCCDTYGVYAFTSFIVTELGTFVKPDINAEGGMILYPNPTTGRFNVEITNMDKLKKITAYSLSGQIVFEENLDGSGTRKSLDLRQLNKGVYFIEVLTLNNKMTKKLIIQ